MTTPSSAIFWSRPRMRCPPHGDTLPNGGGDQGLRAGPHLWRGSPCGEGRFMHVTGIAYLEL